jgi:DNA topoisomerase-2
MKQGVGGLEKAFGLKTNLQLTNMHAFDANGAICKFESAESIADSYFPTRLSLYHDRKSVLQSSLEYSSVKLRNKARFIGLVSQGKIDLLSGKVSKEQSYAEVKKLEFPTAGQMQEIRNNNSLRGNRPEDDSTENSSVALDKDYDYLFKMPLSSLTREKIEDLTRDATQAESNLQGLLSTNPEELWMADLEKLASHL